MHFFVFLLWQQCCSDVASRGCVLLCKRLCAFGGWGAAVPRVLGGGLCALCAGYCGFAAITHALRALLRQSRRHRTKGAG